VVAAPPSRLTVADPRLLAIVDTQAPCFPVKENVAFLPLAVANDYHRGFPLANLDCDFVVLVALNRGCRYHRRKDLTALAVAVLPSCKFSQSRLRRPVSPAWSARHAAGHPRQGRAG